jgi:transposase
LSKRGINCIVVNAADIPKSDKEKKNKTDSVDAKSIAENLAASKLVAIHIPDTKTESDRQLVRCRLALLRDLQRTKNRIKSALRFKGITISDKFDNTNWSKAFVEWLKSIETEHSSGKLTLTYLIEQLQWQRIQLLKITRDARAVLEESAYDTNTKLLLSVPGIGPLNAVTILTEVGDISRFERAIHFNSFLGLCPMEHSSGQDERKGGITMRCNIMLRPMIIEAAWVAIRHDPALTMAFENYKRRGLTAKRAIIKIAHKLANRIYHVLKEKELYEKGTMK